MRTVAFIFATASWETFSDDGINVLRPGRTTLEIRVSMDAFDADGSHRIPSLTYQVRLACFKIHEASCELMPMTALLSWFTR